MSSFKNYIYPVRSIFPRREAVLQIIRRLYKRNIYLREINSHFHLRRISQTVRESVIYASFSFSPSESLSPLSSREHALVHAYLLTRQSACSESQRERATVRGVRKKRAVVVVILVLLVVVAAAAAGPESERSQVHIRRGGRERRAFAGERSMRVVSGRLFYSLSPPLSFSVFRARPECKLSTHAPRGTKFTVKTSTSPVISLKIIPYLCVYMGFRNSTYLPSVCSSSSYRVRTSIDKL